MKPRYWSRFAKLAAGVMTALGMATAAFAQESLEERLQRLERQNEEIRKNAEVIQKQNDTLMKMLNGPPSSQVSAPGTAPLAVEDVRSIVSGYLQEKEAKQKASEGGGAKTSAKKDFWVVGDDRNLNASWDNGGIRLKSADEAFKVHIGGRMMADQVWFNQSSGLLKSTSQAGTPLANQTGVGPGIGPLLDAFFFRRLRLVADGTVYQTIDFGIEFDFENYNNLTFDQCYVGARDLPFIDMVRFGQVHVPYGLEAYASSRWLSTMERSPLFDAFYQEFAPGIFTNTTFFDKHMTTQHMFHRIDNFNQFNGDSFGDGRYAYSGRVTFLPIYENDGRCLLHLGLAYQYRLSSIPSDFNGGTTTTTSDLVRFRTRQSIRDAIGAQGNSARIVDTGNIIANDVQGVNFEVLQYVGPFSLQGEANLSHTDGAFYPATAAAKNRGDLDYWGTYIQLGYFLTGENRGYDKRMGKHDRVVPNENFFLVRDEDGHIQYGLGAWEMVYRFGVVNLNDDNINGGIYDEHTVGVNWYWTPSIKFQANYIIGHRSVPAPANNGTVQGFGLRGVLEF